MTCFWPELLPVRFHGVRLMLSLSLYRTVDEDGVLRGFACHVQPQCSSRYPGLSTAGLSGALTRTDLVRLMLWEFTAALSCVQKYDELALGIRVQISTPQMQLCLKTAELMACLRDGLGILALETSSPLGEDGLIAVNRLSEVCPVWLGRFGTGEAGMVTALSSPFSGVVLAPALLREAQTVPEGLHHLRAQTHFLSARRRHSVVLEETGGTFFQGLRGCGLAGFQEIHTGS